MTLLCSDMEMVWGSGAAEGELEPKKKNPRLTLTAGYSKQGCHHQDGGAKRRIKNGSGSCFDPKQRLNRFCLCAFSGQYRLGDGSGADFKSGRVLEVFLDRTLIGGADDGRLVFLWKFGRQLDIQ